MNVCCCLNILICNAYKSSKVSGARDPPSSSNLGLIEAWVVSSGIGHGIECGEKEIPLSNEAEENKKKGDCVFTE